MIVGGPEALAGPLGELAPTVVFDPLGGVFVAPVVDAVAPRARIVSFGTSAGPQVTFNMQQLYRKGLTLLGYGGIQFTTQERRAAWSRPSPRWRTDR